MEGLTQVLERCMGSDLIVFGIQEMIDLHPTNNVTIESNTKAASNWVKAIEKGLANNPKNLNYISIQEI